MPIKYFQLVYFQLHLLQISFNVLMAWKKEKWWEHHLYHKQVWLDIRAELCHAVLIKLSAACENLDELY